MWKKKPITNQEEWLKRTKKWMLYTLVPSLVISTFTLFSHLSNNSILKAPIFQVPGSLIILTRAVKSIFGYRGRGGIWIMLYIVGCIALVVLSYAIVYRYIVSVNPHSFADHSSLSGVDALYYCIYTFADYGTLTPLTTLAKWIVMSQMVFTFLSGSFVMGILVSILLQARE